MARKTKSKAAKPAAANGKPADGTPLQAALRSLHICFEYAARPALNLANTTEALQ